jgi:uncharacterized membrane protein
MGDEREARTEPFTLADLLVYPIMQMDEEQRRWVKILEERVERLEARVFARVLPPQGTA